MEGEQLLNDLIYYLSRGKYDVKLCVGEKEYNFNVTEEDGTIYLLADDND